MLVANRLLPEALPADWPPRGDLVRYVFWAGWVLALVHAFVRGVPVSRGQINPAWREQCAAVAVLAFLAVLLNAFTTRDHLLKTLAALYWPVAGMDLCLLATAALAVVAVRKLGGRAGDAQRMTSASPDGRGDNRERRADDGIRPTRPRQPEVQS